ncbi:hypothetical protein CA51_48940 [Rosistilla oblonga]|uniref:HAMP domain-containing protein n=1 Tax=Rosistilla oblonga TaxID=2527990 RepID=A0A518IUW6_9BACT|nr:hypothetical protein [Rosistilla oblonga]QDV14984.1 hypothetical protein CA51_48940 [Rosistilla oblonga]QDV56867.1 hypothetical protein Mal33_28680 [Rosistilla oblonga]
MSKSTRRKSNFVDPETQLSLLKRITLHWCSFIAANSVALVIWLMLFEQEPGASWGETGNLFMQRYAPFLIISAAMLPIFLRDTMRLSNRFAGPIQRLRRAMEAVAEGSHVKPISFRKGDFLQDLASDFNLVLARYQKSQSDSATRVVKSEQNETQVSAAEIESESPVSV